MTNFVGGWYSSISAEILLSLPPNTYVRRYRKPLQRWPQETETTALILGFQSFMRSGSSRYCQTRSGGALIRTLSFRIISPCLPSSRIGPGLPRLTSEPEQLRPQPCRGLLLLPRVASHSIGLAAQAASGRGEVDEVFCGPDPVFQGGVFPFEMRPR